MIYNTPSSSPLVTPPLPPRPVDRGQLVRQYFTSAIAILGLVFTILGFTFSMIGLVFAFVMRGVPAFWIFPLVGLFFLIDGLVLSFIRYTQVQGYRRLMQDGQAALGQVTSARPNYHVRVNGRHPWIVTYRFNALGGDYTGSFSTLQDLGPASQPGAPVYVLYEPDRPERNMLYL